MKSLLLLLALLYCSRCQNLRPIIGILAEPKLDGPGTDPKHSHFPGEYVRWLSQAGSRVAVLRYDMPEATLKFLFNSLNGILFTGGEDTLLLDTPYYQAALKIFNWAIEANGKGNYFPLWGTCQGFQLLSVLGSGGDESVLLRNHYNSYNYSIPIDLTPEAATSRLLKGLRPETIETLTHKNATMNLHFNGVLPTSYQTNLQLSKMFKLISMNVDRDGVPFGSTMEGREFPFYATQWHPERNQFDWGTRENLDKSPDALRAMQDLSDFFVSETRKNFNRFPSVAEETENLIFNWIPVFTGANATSSFPSEETFIFPAWQ